MEKRQYNRIKGNAAKIYIFLSVMLVVLFASCEANSSSYYEPNLPAGESEPSFSDFVYPEPEEMAEESDEQEKSEELYPVGAMDRFAAAEQGGVFVKIGEELYFPAVWVNANNMDEYYSEPNVVFAAEEDAQIIPTVNAECQLVIFSEQSIKQVAAFPVLQDGYTIPISFRGYDDYSGIWEINSFSIGNGKSDAIRKIVEQIESDFIMWG